MTETPNPLPAVTRTVLLDARLRDAKTTERVQIRQIRMAAGAAAGLHVHNGPVFGSIVAGSVVYQIDGEPETVLRPGDVFYEPGGARIARFDARGEDVVFLAHFLLSAEQEPAIDFPDA